MERQALTHTRAMPWSDPTFDVCADIVLFMTSRGERDLKERERREGEGEAQRSPSQSIEIENRPT